MLLYAVPLCLTITAYHVLTGIDCNMTVNRIKFTATSVDGLTCALGKDKEFFWDERLPGFGVCVRPGGRKTWVVQYRTTDGKSRRVTLGTVASIKLDEARKAARECLGAASLGQDPGKAKADQRKAIRTCEMIDAYLSATVDNHKPKYRREVERHLQRQTAPLHSVPAESVTRQDIHTLVQAVSKSSGPTAANRLRASLSALWTWGLRTGRIQGENVVTFVPKPAKEQVRDRVLADWELALIWRCTDRDHDYDRIVRLLMLTGARREEVAALPWTEIEVLPDGSALWTLDKARSKNGLPHEVPLVPSVVALLPPRIDSRHRLFGRGDNGFSGWSKSKERLDERLTAAGDGAKIEPWTLHDLRRTVSTWCNENGVDPHVVEAMLNHASGSARQGVAGRYNKAMYREPKRKGFALWAAHVARLSAEN